MPTTFFSATKSVETNGRIDEADKESRNRARKLSPTDDYYIDYALNEGAGGHAPQQMGARFGFAAVRKEEALARVDNACESILADLSFSPPKGWRDEGDCRLLMRPFLAARSALHSDIDLGRTAPQIKKSGNDANSGSGSPKRTAAEEYNDVAQLRDVYFTQQEPLDAESFQVGDGDMRWVRRSGRR